MLPERLRQQHCFLKISKYSPSTLVIWSGYYLGVMPAKIFAVLLDMRGIKQGVTYNIHWSTNFPGIYTIIFTIIVSYYLIVIWFRIVFKFMFTWPVNMDSDARRAYTCNHTTAACFSKMILSSHTFLNTIGLVNGGKHCLFFFFLFVL